MVEEREDGVRVLATGRARILQSAMRPGDPSHLEFEYTRLVLVALLLVPRPRRIAVLGLGAGTLPRFFRWLLPEVEVDAVEIDSEMVRVARESFELVEDARCRVTIADARRFLETTDGRWDLVIADAFAGDVVPPQLSTIEFFRLVRHRLSPGGALVVNVWGPPNPRFGSTRRTVREAFETVLDLAGEADRNHVLVAPEQPTELSCAQLVARAREPVGAHPLPFDLARAIERAYAGIVPKNAPGRILRDDPPRPKLTSATRSP